MRIKKEKSQVGLDIGNYSLKIMEVLADQQPPVITHIGIYELPFGPIEQNLPKGLKSLLESTHITTKGVNISISGPNVIVRFIELPLMQDSELYQAIPYEAEKYIPFDIKELILDYVILEKNQADRKMSVLLVGAKKNFVERRIKLVEDIGLVPNTIDVDSFAVFNAFTKSIPSNGGGAKTIALLNMGAGLTNVALVYRDLPWMVRDINFGGTNLVQVLQEKLGISGEEAQALKHNPGQRVEEVLTIFRESLQKLVDEIRLSFTYYEDKHGRGVDEVYISGGSLGLNGLISFLKESTGIDVKQWDSLKPFKIDPQVSKENLEKFRSSFAVCSGLALRT